MSLRDGAIKAMIDALADAEAECLGCDCEVCRRGAGAALDGLLDWLRGQTLDEEPPFRGLMSVRHLCDLLSEEER